MSSVENSAGGGASPDYYGFNTTGFVIAFDFFNIFALLFLVVVVMTAACSSRVTRSCLWYNFLISWIVYAGSNLLILGQQYGPAPNHIVCLIQTSFIYSTAPLTSYCGLALLIQLCRHLSSSIGSGRTPDFQYTPALLRYSPLVPAAIPFFMTIGIGSANPDFVQRDSSAMYCNLSAPETRITSSIIVLLSMVTVLGLQGYVAIIFGSNWRTLKVIRAHGGQGAITYIALVIRLGFFGFLPTIALGVAFSYALPNAVWTPQSGATINMIPACLPVAAALVFGTQEDLLSVWAFWKRKQNTGDISPDIPSARPSNTVPMPVDIDEQDQPPTPPPKDAHLLDRSFDYQQRNGASREQGKEHFFVRPLTGAHIV